MTLLQPGSPAPDFSADASDGQRYRLTDLLQESRVLLVFYPRHQYTGLKPPTLRRARRDRDLHQP
ncbi:MAG: redoxin domain-containing protein [Gemmatimonadales bacterium]